MTTVCQDAIKKLLTHTPAVQKLSKIYKKTVQATNDHLRSTENHSFCHYEFTMHI